MKNEDKLIQDWYGIISIREIAKRLNKDYGRTNTKIQNMKKRGKLFVPKDPVETLIANLDEKLNRGKKYRVKNISKRASNFEGTLISKMDKYYIFRSILGYTECFLKVDFAIGEYRIEEVR